nr:nitroreductase family protein [Rhodoferax sp.]
MMPTSIQSLIESRASTQHFDPERTISDAQVTELVHLATRAPSAYHLQNWRFYAVRSPQAKARLHAVAHRQAKVLEAAVTFIVCGTLGAHAQLAQALQPSVAAGLLPQSVSDTWVAMAQSSYGADAQLQRDEAVRSASLAAMTLMLAAQGMGLVSGALGGFDAPGVVQAFGLAPQELPVILVSVGYSAADASPQHKPRRPLHEVMCVV